MKKLILALFLVFIMAESVFAATPGTCTISSQVITVQNQQSRKILTLSWVASVDAATVPATTITATTYGIEGWYLYSGETNPGATQPTPNYDITITDADGADLAGGMLMDRSATATQGPVAMALGTTGHYPVVRGNLTFTLSNNAVNSALGTCILTFISN